MKINFYPFLALLFVMYGMPALAQDDSWLDLGSTRLEKKFTQHISIKGEDLEKMSFSNLSDAINVWLYGIYSNTGTLVYIVDGNIITDVNAWSIYDIKEIVFVQSALVQTAGNTGQQNFVLVTTRRYGPGKPHAGSQQANPFSFRAAGQTALVNRDYHHLYSPAAGSSTTNLYHQYYLSGSYTQGKVQAGVSASWLRDVFPSETNDSTHWSKPYQLNRYRFTAYLDAVIGRRSQLSINVAAVPVRAPAEATTTSATISATGNQKETQLMVTPSLQFSTNLGKGFQNIFSASYQSFNSHYNEASQGLQVVSPGGGQTQYQSLVTDDGDATAVAIRDNLSLTRHAGNWTIMPAVNIQYVYEKISVSEKAFYATGNPGSLGGGISNSSSTYGLAIKGHLFSATPSANFSYKSILSFGAGGFVYLPQSGTKETPAKIFPFGHVSVDLLKIGNNSNKNSLQLFGSVARSYNYSFTAGQLDDFSQNISSSGVSLPPLPAYVLGTGTVVYTPVTVPNQYASLFGAHTIWTTGATLRLDVDKLLVNYNFEQRDFTSPQEIINVIPGTSTYYVDYPRTQSFTHHIGVSTKIKLGSSFQWQPGITLTNIRVKGNAVYFPEGNLPGDFSPYTSWSGGWVNRISAKRFFAGLDILYHLGTYGQPSGVMANYYLYSKKNSVDLQNIYLGYAIQVCKTHAVDIYINSRNLAQNSASDLTDWRRYYGAGFKTSF